MYDNSVTVVSDKSYTGDYAVLSQYSMDNALGHDIPEAIVNSALDMVAVDLPRQSTIDYIRLYISFFAHTSTVWSI